jgi:K+-sensing histidine kinase KdpD
MRPLAIEMFTSTPDRSIYVDSRLNARSRLKPLLVIVLCGGLALGLSVFFRNGAMKPAAPAIFVLVIISVAHFCGRFASLLVGIVGCLVFAAFLFEPYGSLAVYNAADRLVLLWFALCAIAAVCLSTKPDPRRK